MASHIWNICVWSSGFCVCVWERVFISSTCSLHKQVLVIILFKFDIKKMVKDNFHKRITVERIKRMMGDLPLSRQYNITWLIVVWDLNLECMMSCGIVEWWWWSSFVQLVGWPGGLIRWSFGKLVDWKVDTATVKAIVSDGGTDFRSTDFYVNKLDTFVVTSCDVVTSCALTLILIKYNKSSKILWKILKKLGLRWDYSS